MKLTGILWVFSVVCEKWPLWANFSNTRRACLLDSGGTIWLLWVYRDPVGIKIDSVGTSRRKWPAVINNVVFLA